VIRPVLMDNVQMSMAQSSVIVIQVGQAQFATKPSAQLAILITEHVFNQKSANVFTDGQELTVMWLSRIPIASME